ncbi:hypothetical protein [Methylobacterium sp.]|uniref:hypothetical protein n=1 Tax=Methylobacterium sp. TaxID=409 RepID=UPI000C4A1D5D|nr:hypothetical protein [Methylobacterium sp.]MBP27872.1 hypothetical protein [Methylobacterium sp.]
MPAARDLTVDQHGVKQAGRYVVTCGIAAAGGIFVIGGGWAHLDADAADHLADLLREHAKNERLVEATAALICEAAAP